MVWEGEEGEQGIKTLFEKIMTENYPNLAKEIDIEIQKLQSPNNDDPRKIHTKTHLN